MKFLCNIGKFVEQNAKIFQQYQKIFPYKIYSIFLGKKKKSHIFYIINGCRDVGFSTDVASEKEN